MKRAYYSDSIANFLAEKSQSVLGEILTHSDFSVEQTQRDSWIHQIQQLKLLLAELNGSIYFEYSIPRMGKRVDVVLVIGAAVFVIEYKVGEKLYSAYAVDQVTDYALDLKNFHETSHDLFVVPILIATGAPENSLSLKLTPHKDKLLSLIHI